MNKKIAVIKNGYDILRIVEGKNDKNSCEFKILPMIDSKEVRVFALQLFSDVEEVTFDNNCKLEITYHKATISKPTKIHLKLEDSNKNVKYIDLPLKHLIDPDINTEIPIPLLKIVVPNEALVKQYNPKPNEHVVFDIKENNIIEIFMKRSGDIGSTNFEKWFNINMFLNINSMQYLATGNDKFLGQNYAATFAGSSGSVHNISMCADVTADIGLQLNTVKSEIVTKKLNFLFIDNEAYLGFAGGVRIFNSEHPNGIHNYKLDLANDKFFDSKSREKWEYRFTKELKNLDKLIANSNGKYQKQFEKLDEEYKQIQLLANKVSEFKVKLKAVKEKFFKNNLIYYSKDLSILLAKYLGLDEVIIFCTTLRGSTEFDEVLLCYKNYLIELCRGELNQFVPEANEKEFVIAKAVFNKDEYYKNGYYKPLIEKYNYKIVRQGFYKFNREKMNDLFEDEKMQFKSLYEYLK